MNYGRRTTKTTTHRDTPLSATPEPRFQNLAEITVTPSKEQIKSYTSKANAEAERLNKDSNIKGALNLEVLRGENATLRRLKEISSYPPEFLLDYGNPADKPNLKKISTSRANLEKAKKDNAYQNRVYNKNRQAYFDIGGEDLLNN